MNDLKQSIELDALDLYILSLNVSFQLYETQGNKQKSVVQIRVSLSFNYKYIIKCKNVHSSFQRYSSPHL